MSSKRRWKTQRKKSAGDIWIVRNERCKRNQWPTETQETFDLYLLHSSIGTVT